MQSRKFDPDGVYIRRYVDELANIESDIHDPSPEERDRLGYPAPLVDHHEAIDQWRAEPRPLMFATGTTCVSRDARTLGRTALP